MTVVLLNLKRGDFQKYMIFTLSMQSKTVRQCWQEVSEMTLLILDKIGGSAFAPELTAHCGVWQDTKQFKKLKSISALMNSYLLAMVAGMVFYDLSD